MSTFELMRRLKLQKEYKAELDKYDIKFKKLILLFIYSITLNVFFISYYINILFYNILWTVLIYYIIFFNDKIWRQVVKSGGLW